MGVIIYPSWVYTVKTILKVAIVIAIITTIIILIVRNERKKIKLMQEQNKLLKDHKESK